MNKKKINNLIFSGGGVKSLCFLGCLKALEELNDKKIIDLDIQSISASSGGVIISLLYIIGYTPAELTIELLQTNFKLLQDIKLMNILSKFGLDNSDKMINFIETLMLKRGISKNITFSKLFELFNVDFIITATNLNTFKLELFNKTNTPDFKVIRALKYSTSVPILFTAKENDDSDVYVDGSIIDNYPIRVFKNALDTTLGFKIVTRGELPIHDKYIPITNFQNYVVSVITCLLAQKEKFTSLSNKYKEHTVFIYSDIESIDFNISDESKLKLIEAGFAETKMRFNEKTENKDVLIKIKDD